MYTRARDNGSRARVQALWRRIEREVDHGEPVHATTRAFALWYARHASCSDPGRDFGERLTDDNRGTP